jgi:hypothetical protein
MTPRDQTFCQSSPLIFMFSSNYRYLMFNHVVIFAMVSLKREWEPIIVFMNDPTVSYTVESRDGTEYASAVFYKNVQVRSRGIIDTPESELFNRLSRFSRQMRSPIRNGFGP